MNNQEFSGYDIIGDVHGCAMALRRLLEKLGYVEVDGCYTWSNPDAPRQAVFLGDLIDRGSGIRETLLIVKTMADAGHARVIMGNHEMNAIAYHTWVDEDYLRPHNERSNLQIRETLEQFGNYPQEWQDYLRWFEGLPLFIEFDNFRVVHACWDEELISRYLKYYNTNKINKNIIYEMNDYNGLVFRLIDRLTKGISLHFSDRQSVLSRDGFFRHSFRVNFWSSEAETYNDIVFQPDPLPAGYKEKTISDVEKDRLIHYGVDEKPLFIGHYWLEGKPELVAPNIACLDYSAVNGGKLVAYQMDACDKCLSNDRFIYVEVPEEDLQ